MWNLILCLVCNVYGYILPAYASYKAIERNDQHTLSLWLHYWIVLGLFTTTEGFVSPLINWVPFYYFIKTTIHIYLVAPQAQGALYVYKHVLEPWFIRHEADIDIAISRAQSRMTEAGIEYSQRFMAYCVNIAREFIYGPQHKRTLTRMTPSSSSTPTPVTSDTGALVRTLASTFINVISGATTLSAPSRSVQNQLTRNNNSNNRSLLSNMTTSISARYRLDPNLSRDQQVKQLQDIIRQIQNAPPTPPDPSSSTRPIPYSTDVMTDDDEFEKVQVPPFKSTQSGNSTGWTSWLWKSSTSPSESVVETDAKGRSKEKVS